MSVPASLKLAVKNSLSIWHEMVASGDMSRLGGIVHPDAVFYSPVAFKPYPSAAALMLVLSTVAQVFKGLTYDRQLGSDDGLTAMLEFKAHIGEKSIHGIDIIRFNEEGQIVEFQVMARPLSAVQALGEEMKARIGHLLPK